MWQRCTSLLALVLMLTGGCASTPPAVNSAATVTQPAVMTPDGDMEDRYQAVLTLMTSQEWQSAATGLEAFTAAYPELSGPWVNLGIARTMLGDSQAAESAFRQALQVNPANAEAYNQLGILYRRTGRLEQARAAYNSGLQQAPSHTDLHWNLGILHELYLPDPALALAHYERYQQLTKQNDPQMQRWVVELRKQVPPKEADSMTAETKK